MTVSAVLHPDLDQLAAPLAPQDVEWKPGATTRDKKKGLAMAYLTSRAIQDRLDEVCGPAGWRNEFVPGPAGGVLCGLSIRVTYADGTAAWVTKWDGADNTDVEAVKGGLSSAMKRAAVLWGIGRYLYQLDAQWVELDQRGRFAQTPRLPAQFRPTPSRPQQDSSPPRQAPSPASPSAPPPQARASQDRPSSFGGDGARSGQPHPSASSNTPPSRTPPGRRPADAGSPRDVPPSFAPRAGERRVRR